MMINLAECLHLSDENEMKYLCLTFAFCVLGTISVFAQDETPANFVSLVVERSNDEPAGLVVSFMFAEKDASGKVGYSYVKANKTVTELIGDRFLELSQTEAILSNYKNDLKVTGKQGSQFQEAVLRVNAELGRLGELVRTDQSSDRELKKLAHTIAQSMDSVNSDIFDDVQIKRLKQLRFAAPLLTQGLVASLDTQQFRREFSITDAQIHAIKKVKPELEKEFAEEAYQLREKYRAKLLDELTPKQRQQLESMMGEPIEHYLDAESILESIISDILRL